MFKQFARRREKLKEKEQSQEQELPLVEHQQELNCIPFQDLKLGKCYQMLVLEDSMKNFMIHKILILSEGAKYQVYYNASYSIVNTKNAAGNRLVKGKTYYYKVRTYKVVNGKTYYGPMSTIKSIKAK